METGKRMNENIHSKNLFILSVTKGPMTFFVLAQIFLEAHGFRDVRVDAEASDGLSVFIADKHGGGAQKLPIPGIHNVVVAVPVLHCPAQHFQPEV